MGEDAIPFFWISILTNFFEREVISISWFAALPRSYFFFFFFLWNASLLDFYGCGYFEAFEALPSGWPY